MTNLHKLRNDIKMSESALKRAIISECLAITKVAFENCFDLTSIGWNQRPDDEGYPCLFGTPDDFDNIYINGFGTDGTTSETETQLNPESEEKISKELADRFSTLSNEEFQLAFGPDALVMFYRNGTTNFQS